MSFAPVISLVGWLLALFAASTLVPVLVALGYGEVREAAVFGGTAAVALFCGVGMIFATQGSDRTLSRRGAFLLMVLVWPLLAFFGAVPLFLLDAAPTMTDAFFEATSGVTTTGATVLNELDALARSVVFWRAWLQWLGGLATIAFVVSLLPMLGIGGMELFASAMPHGEQATLEARLRRSGLALGWVYVLLTGVCVASLMSAGMAPFDAVGHALSTLSTGGFSTRDGSVAAFQSPLVEAVLILFMIAGAVNITLFWAFLNARPRAFVNDPEAKLLVPALIAATAAAWFVLDPSGTGEGLAALRHVSFAVTSALTTTGFTSGPHEDWPVFLQILLLALMFIGGSTGSTVGGVKLMRLVLMLKHGGREFARLAHPRGAVTIRYAGEPVSERSIPAAWSFLVLLVTAIAVLAVALSSFGLDTPLAVSMALATLANNGAGLAEVIPGASYVVLPDAAKWILCAGMMLGRVELVAALALCTPMFWRR